MSFICRMRSIRNLVLENVRRDKPRDVGFNASLRKGLPAGGSPLRCSGRRGGEHRCDRPGRGVTTTGHQNGKSSPIHPFPCRSDGGSIRTGTCAGVQSLPGLSVALCLERSRNGLLRLYLRTLRSVAVKSRTLPWCVLCPCSSATGVRALRCERLRSSSPSTSNSRSE